jgi:putative oxidoreductase
MGTVPFFDAIGWGQWLRYASGVVDTAGALLVFIPRFTSPGAFMITCSVGLGTFLCFTKEVFNPAFPLVMTLLAAALVWLGRRSRAA